MKVDFPLPTDGKQHIYCLTCKKEGAVEQKEDGLTAFMCPHCGTQNPRALYVSDGRFWLDENHELWHETGGFFIRKPDNTFMFYIRDTWPFAVSIPAGHINTDENPEIGALRELREETGLQPKPGEYSHVATTEVIGDQCAGGAESHVWSLYVMTVPQNADVHMLEESKGVRWWTLDRALRQDVTYAVRYLIEHYAEELQK